MQLQDETCGIVPQALSFERSIGKGNYRNRICLEFIVEQGSRPPSTKHIQHFLSHPRLSGLRQTMLDFHSFDLGSFS